MISFFLEIWKNWNYLNNTVIAIKRNIHFNKLILFDFDWLSFFWDQWNQQQCLIISAKVLGLCGTLGIGDASQWSARILRDIPDTLLWQEFDCLPPGLMCVGDADVVECTMQTLCNVVCCTLKLWIAFFVYLIVYWYFSYLGWENGGRTWLYGSGIRWKICHRKN